MKTTIKIADALMREAKRVAARDGTTVRALIEQGLRRELSERGRTPVFRLRHVTVRGDGLQPGVSWERLAELANERSSR